MIVDENTKIYIGDTKIKKVYQGNTNITPLPYTELEYIESTGIQYIDLQYINTINSSYEFSIMATKYNDKYNTIFGARTHHQHSDSFDLGFERSNILYINIYGTTINPVTTDFQLNKDYIFKMDNQKLIYNGVTRYYSSWATPRPGVQSMYLFKLNGEVEEPVCIRLYYFKIYEQDDLVHDFIPVLDKNDIPCLWDKVEEKFYYNQGTGQFLYG